MTKITCGEKYLRAPGMGTTTDPTQGHDYTADEAHALTELYPDYVAEMRALPLYLAAKAPPSFPAGEGRVWVRYKGTWLAAEKQAMLMGTRTALEPVKQQEVTW